MKRWSETLRLPFPSQKNFLMRDMTEDKLHILGDQTLVWPIWVTYFGWPNILCDKIIWVPKYFGCPNISGDKMLSSKTLYCCRTVCPVASRTLDRISINLKTTQCQILKYIFKYGCSIFFSICFKNFLFWLQSNHFNFLVQTYLIHIFPFKVDAIPGVNDRTRLKTRFLVTI